MLVLEGMTAIKTALEIVKGAKDLNNTTLLKSKISELYLSLLTAYEAMTEKENKIMELNQVIRSIQTWESEKARYELKELNPGAFAYVIKESERGDEPAHKICAACYEQGKKGILQLNTNVGPRRLQCPFCKNYINSSQ